MRNLKTDFGVDMNIDNEITFYFRDERRRPLVSVHAVRHHDSGDWSVGIARFSHSETLLRKRGRDIARGRALRPTGNGRTVHPSNVSSGWPKTTKLYDLDRNNEPYLVAMLLSTVTDQEIEASDVYNQVKKALMEDGVI